MGTHTHTHTQTNRYIYIYHMFMNSCQLQINCRELFNDLYIYVNGKTSRFIEHQKAFAISWFKFHPIILQINTPHTGYFQVLITIYSNINCHHSDKYFYRLFSLLWGDLIIYAVFWNKQKYTVKSKTYHVIFINSR